jgi:two-component system, NarL family, invasion response regulator UvrY
VKHVIKVLVADDHPVVRRGLVDIVTRGLGQAACGEAADSSQVLESVQRETWDLLILDVSMPGRSGLDILADLKRMRPKLPVLVLSVHSEEQYGKRALRAGASGYLGKETAPEELIGAIRHVLAGRRYLSPALAEKLAVNSLEEGDRPPHEKLSDREFEVLRMIGSGKTTSQIAAELHLSVTTVSTYRARILEKMKMKTTAELMHYAVTNHLTD